MIMAAMLLLSGQTACDQPKNAPSVSASPIPAPVIDYREQNLIPEGYRGRVAVISNVAESLDGSVHVCVARMEAESGGAAAANAAGCGPRIATGWSWDGLKPESAQGRTYARDVRVVGRFDGTTFHLTEPPKHPEDSQRLDPFPQPPSCVSPSVTDPGSATQEAFEKAAEISRATGDFGGYWFDKSPLSPITPQTTFNVWFTKDLAVHEAEIRKFWGGKLCVHLAKHSYLILRTKQHHFAGKEPLAMGVSVDYAWNAVVIDVLVASTKRQRELDAEYGPGAVRLFGIAVPLD